MNLRRTRCKLCLSKDALIKRFTVIYYRLKLCRNTIAMLSIHKNNLFYFNSNSIGLIKFRNIKLTFWCERFWYFIEIWHLFQQQKIHLKILWFVHTSNRYVLCSHVLQVTINKQACFHKGVSMNNHKILINLGFDVTYRKYTLPAFILKTAA